MVAVPLSSHLDESLSDVAAAERTAPASNDTIMATAQRHATKA